MILCIDRTAPRGDGSDSLVTLVKHPPASNRKHISHELSPHKAPWEELAELVITARANSLDVDYATVGSGQCFLPSLVSIEVKGETVYNRAELGNHNSPRGRPLGK